MILLVLWTRHHFGPKKSAQTVSESDAIRDATAIVIGIHDEWTNIIMLERMLDGVMTQFHIQFC
jgi:hypothetical protein